jgi:hypothetical protein
MLEVVNELAPARLRELDNFLSFIGIYDDARRLGAFTRLLMRNRALIRGAVGVEAGAGLGTLTEFILRLGCRKIYAVEENGFCCQHLRRKFKAEPRVEVVRERIERFRPRTKIDFLFQELYGGLLLDESLLALERIRFDPGVVIPDGGKILAEEVSFRRLADPTIDSALGRLLEGALVTDLFPYFRFRQPFIFGEWKYRRRRTVHEFTSRPLKKSGVLALGMEVWHGGTRITGTQNCVNWPYVFTPVKPGRLTLSFCYKQGHTRVLSQWRKERS